MVESSMTLLDNNIDAFDMTVIIIGQKLNALTCTVGLPRVPGCELNVAY